MSETPWYERGVLGFDTETTGIDTSADRLVTYSLVYKHGSDQRYKYGIVNPGVPIPPGASKVHGITDEVAQRDGVAPAIALEEIVGALYKMLSEGRAVIAFNAAYDLTLLENECVRHGVEPLSARLGHAPCPVIDPFLIDKTFDKYRRGKRRLENLCEHYGVNAEGFHNAQADVEATLGVLAAQIKRYGSAITSLSVEELQAAERATHEESARYFYRRAVEGGRTPEPLPESWPVTNAVSLGLPA